MKLTTLSLDQLDKALKAYKEFPNRETLEHIGIIISLYTHLSVYVPDELMAELILEGLIDD